MTDSVRHVVAGALRAEMARQQIDLRTLAARVGKSHTWVWTRAAGKVPCDVEDLALIATALGVPMTTFLPAPEVAA